MSFKCHNHQSQTNCSFWLLAIDISFFPTLYSGFLGLLISVVAKLLDVFVLKQWVPFIIPKLHVLGP